MRSSHSNMRFIFEMRLGVVNLWHSWKDRTAAGFDTFHLAEILPFIECFPRRNFKASFINNGDMPAMNLRGNLYRGPDRFSSNSWTNDRKQP